MYLGFNQEDYNFSIRFYNNRSSANYSSQGIILEKGEYIKYIHYNPRTGGFIGSLLIDFLNINFRDINSFKYFFETWGYSGFYGLSEIAKEADTLSFNDDSYYDFIRKVLKDCMLNSGLEITQKKFQTLVDFCFNTNKLEYLKMLNPSQRVFLYEQKRNFDYEDIAQYSNNTQFEFRAIPNKDSNLNYPKLIKLDIPQFAKEIENINIEFVEEYKTDNLLSICYLELMELIKKNASINKCENCGIYFIPQVRNNEIYCDQCKDIGYINKVKKDPYMTAYRNEYKSRNAKLRKITNPSKKEVERTSLKEWSKRAVQIARDKSIPIEDFKTWLKEV